MKKLCQTEKNIVERIKQRHEDPNVSNRALFGLHCTMYHRNVTEYGKTMELCRVWNDVVDCITWEELVAIAATEGTV